MYNKPSQKTLYPCVRVVGPSRSLTEVASSPLRKLVCTHECSHKDVEKTTTAGLRNKEINFVSSSDNNFCYLVGFFFNLHFQWKQI